MGNSSAVPDYPRVSFKYTYDFDQETFVLDTYTVDENLAEYCDNYKGSFRPLGIVLTECLNKLLINNIIKRGNIEINAEIYNDFNKSEYLIDMEVDASSYMRYLCRRSNVSAILNDVNTDETDHVEVAENIAKHGSNQ